MSSQPRPSRAQLNDVIAGLVIMGVSGWMWTVSAEFPAVPQRYNRVLIGGLVLLSAVQVVRAAVRLLLARRADGHTEGGSTVAGPAAGAAEPAGEVRGALARWTRWMPAGALFLAGSVLYVWAVPRVGYLVSTTIFLAVGLGTGLGWKVRHLLTATALSGAMYLILDRVVNATVPSGFLL